MNVVSIVPTAATGSGAAWAATGGLCSARTTADSRTPAALRQVLRTAVRREAQELAVLGPR